MGFRSKTQAVPKVVHSGRIDKEALAAKGGVLESGRGHWVRKELRQLEVGEMLFVHRSEWNWRGKGNTPARIANSLNKDTKRVYKTWLAADATGWVIERME